MEEEKPLNPLTEKQLAFCLEYLIDFNGHQAAVRCGYSVKTAKNIASENLAKPNVQQEIKRLIEERRTRVKIDADTVLKELLKIATADIAEAFNENGSLKDIRSMPEGIRKAVSSIEVDELWDDEYDEDGRKRKVQIGETKKIKFWDKNKSLEHLGKHLKLFTEKIEITDTSERAEKLKQARERVAKNKSN